MAKRLATWLRQLANWIDPYRVPAVTADDDPVAAAADQLCYDLADLPQSGEYKRHQVYAKLIKQFPAVPKRDLALAIELAVRRLP